MTLAPIVLFVYNRLKHTQQTIEALQKNEWARDSELFIYSDEAKNDCSQKNVDDVRKYIAEISGFKNVTIIKRDKNWGLADSIINGVTEVNNRYGKVIVLEDDIVTSPFFLKFMNEALNFYEQEKKVWHISGYNYPIDIEGLDDVFLWRRMNCWGWATWGDRWQYFEKNVDKTISEFSNVAIEQFNLDGAEAFFSQVIANKEMKINTWAVFWYVSIFKKNGLCLNFTQTLVHNVGHDGTGVNCIKSDIFDSDLSEKKAINFNVEVCENKKALEKIQVFHRAQKKNIYVRIVNKISRLILKRNLFK